jgi:hypothetical protein
MKKSKDTIGNRSRDLPVYSAVPQPLRHRVPPIKCIYVADIMNVLSIKKVSRPKFN